MSTLHTINKPPGSGLLKNCLAVIAESDAILFIEDGIYHCCSQNALQSIAASVKVYGLREDIVARGTLARVEASIVEIDSPGFVELCCRHDKVVSWF